MPIHVVAARPGHADPSVTLRVYAHVIRDQVAAAADIFARSISAGEEPVRMLVLANPLARGPLRRRRRAVDLGALGAGEGNGTPSLLIRRYLSGVQRGPDRYASWHDRYPSVRTRPLGAEVVGANGSQHGSRWPSPRLGATGS